MKNNFAILGIIAAFYFITACNHLQHPPVTNKTPQIAAMTVAPYAMTIAPWMPNLQMADMK